MAAVVLALGTAVAVIPPAAEAQAPVAVASGASATHVHAQPGLAQKAKPQKAHRSKRPAAGNAAGRAPVPSAARAVDTSHPTRVIGRGTPRSCTSAAVVRAVRAGGIIRFNCGPKRVRIVMKRTAVVPHDTGHKLVVLDGRGKVTLSGAGQRRIIYMNTCEKPFSSPNCNNQSFPRLVLQNLTFVRGDATRQQNLRGPRGNNIGGGGAVFVRGGQLKVVNSRFFRNECTSAGPDVGGAAIRVLSHYDKTPVYIVNSTFGGARGLGGRCSNGGALSSIDVSWVVLNSVISHNAAIGRGQNPAKPGTPGGGLGGGIYTDGDRFTVRIAGSVLAQNRAVEQVGAVFFVSNNRTGTLAVDRSVFQGNDGARLRPYPGIFFLGAGSPKITNTRFS